MGQFLILKLQGMMQAWGGHTYENYRPTLPFPTKSGLVGLIAACLGIDREDKEALAKLSKSFTYAVRLDERDVSTQKITDFHTVLDTYRVDGSVNEFPLITHREYLCDAQFTIAIQFSAKAAYPLECVKEAINYPVYTPYLGRRCCVLSRPLFEAVVEEKNLHSALSTIVPGSGTIYSEVPSNNRLVLRDEPEFKIKGQRSFSTREVFIHATKKLL